MSSAPRPFLPTSGEGVRLGPVLLVDDDAVLRKVVARTLDTNGIDVLEARNGEEALMLVRSRAPALVLLDSRMPGLSGIEVLQALRDDASLQGLTVVLLTGESDVADRIRGLEAGADDYIVKPVAPKELVARVRAHLRAKAAWSTTDGTAATRGPGRAHVERLIEARAFRPVFQPVVDLRTSQVVGYEALTRFDDGTPPDVVFNRAAAVGMGVQLELATLREAVRVARGMPADAFVSLNVSALAVAGVDELAPIVDQCGEGRVVLELTEHEPIEDYDEVGAALKRLGRSVRLAVDDTGAGYASFRHVLALRPDIVKVDASLTSGVDVDTARQALVAGLRACSNAVGSVLVAEAIETEGERAALLGLDVPFGQGYLLGRPADAPWQHD